MPKRYSHFAEFLYHVASNRTAYPQFQENGYLLIPRLAAAFGIANEDGIYEITNENFLLAGVAPPNLHKLSMFDASNGTRCKFVACGFGNIVMREGVWGEFDNCHFGNATEIPSAADFSGGRFKQGKFLFFALSSDTQHNIYLRLDQCQLEQTQFILGRHAALKASFVKANLNGASFTCSDCGPTVWLNDPDYCNPVLFESDFTDATMIGAVMDDLSLIACKFINTDCTDMKAGGDTGHPFVFQHMYVDKCIFQKCKMNGIDFSAGATFDNNDFESLAVEDASFMNTNWAEPWAPDANVTAEHISRNRFQNVSMLRVSASTSQLIRLSMFQDPTVTGTCAKDLQVYFTDNNGVRLIQSQFGNSTSFKCSAWLQALALGGPFVAICFLFGILACKMREKRRYRHYEEVSDAPQVALSDFNNRRLGSNGM